MVIKTISWIAGKKIKFESSSYAGAASVSTSNNIKQKERILQNSSRTASCMLGKDVHVREKPGLISFA
jgi:hypothetical protein